MAVQSSLSSGARWPARPLRQHAALGLMAASGFAGLGYQIVWTQQCALWLGHEAAAVLAVVTAFFGGLAVGAFACTPRIARSRHPGRWYAACELVIAVWSLAIALGLAPLSTAMLDLTGAQPTPAWQWTVAFVGTFVALLPATAAMGATLPAMERTLARWHGDAKRIAALYAANTAGAVVGVLAVAFWLVPTFGLVRTAALCATLNVACALGGARLFAGSATPTEKPADSDGSRNTLWRLAATGLLGIGYEIVVVRVLGQVTEDTVYTFALLLAVYLAGSTWGAAAYARRSEGPAHADAVRDRLLAWQAAACLLGTASLWGADSIRNGMLGALGPGMPAALAAEATLAILAFGPPTVVMGALFSHLSAQAKSASFGFGRALGWNTLGAAAAPLLLGMVLIPQGGAKAAALTVAIGYLALLSTSGRKLIVARLAAVAAIAVAVAAPPLTFLTIPEGGRVISHHEGPMAAVSVVEDADGVARLRIDNHQQEGSSASAFADSRQGILPLLLHPAPRHALFLGLGTGVTATAATRDPDLRVDAVELLPDVIAASSHFTGGTATAAPTNRLRTLAADARRYVRTSAQRYDVIVSDNFHPARSGSGSLYTVEHFEKVRDRLTADGVFCQWLPLHQLDLDTLRSIVRSFGAAYPGGWAMLATYSLETPVLGLIGRRDAGPFDVRRVQARLAEAAPSLRLADLGIPDAYALLGGFVAGPRALAAFAGNAPLNTDDLPVVAYRGPRITYAPVSLPRERLFELLHAVRIEPAELVRADPTTARRLAAYWQARDRFLEAGQHVRPTADVRRMLAQVREPLLAVLRISPDFRPAAEPLQRMAHALDRSDPEAALSLRSALMAVRPSRTELDDTPR
ncbi:MAG: fused MFS/spermidine synthase [Caldimonas sp.]